MMEPALPHEPEETTSTVHTRETEPAEKSLEDMLVRDFYLSFRFSQGNLAHQGHIFEAIFGYYNVELKIPVQVIRNVILSEEFAGRTEEVRPPHRHKTTHDSSARGAASSAYFAMKSSSYTFVNDFGINVDYLAPILKVESDIVMSDIDYQAKLRPRPQGDTSDQHGSLYREFILLGRPTGSQCFDSIFAAMRARMIGLIREYRL